MITFAENFKPRRRELIVPENLVMNVLRVFNAVNRNIRVYRLMSMEIANCGWADEPEMWFIHFDATERKWKDIVRKLLEEGHTVKLKKDGKFYLE